MEGQPNRVDVEGGVAPFIGGSRNLKRGFPVIGTCVQCTKFKATPISPREIPEEVCWLHIILHEVNEMQLRPKLHPPFSHRVEKRLTVRQKRQSADFRGLNRYANQLWGVSDYTCTSRLQRINNLNLLIPAKGGFHGNLGDLAGSAMASVRRVKGFNRSFARYLPPPPNPPRNETH